MSKIIIIGGGLSGLTAGIYARKCGYDTVVLEKNPVLGGLCTSWDRKGFHIDGCIHWLTGTKDGSDLNQTWKDIGLIENPIYAQKSACRFYYEDKEIQLRVGFDEIEQDLLSIAPEDAKEIRKFKKMLIKMANFPLPLYQSIHTMSLPHLIKVGVPLLSYTKFFNYVNKTSCEEYANNFSSPILRKLFTRFLPGPANLYELIFFFTQIVSKNGDIPYKGSRGMIDGVINKYISLGGEYKTLSTVKEIIIENKKVKGVVLNSGEKVYGDYVISAICPSYLLYDIMKGKYKSKHFDIRFADQINYACPTALGIYFAVDKEKINRATKGEVMSLFPCDEFDVGGEKISTLTLRNYGFDPYFDKDGKTVIQILIEQFTDKFSFWDNLYKNKEKYLNYKLNIASKAIESVCKQFPELEKEDFEYLDSFSPSTIKKYTNNFNGGYMPFEMTPRGKYQMSNFKIKGIKNLYVASQWSFMPGGLPLAASCGKFTVQKILKKEHKKYIFNDWKRIKY